MFMVFLWCVIINFRNRVLKVVLLVVFRVVIWVGVVMLDMLW